MNQAETRLIEEGWAALVERLGLANASRFIMLLDRRTGGARQHLQSLWGVQPHPSHRSQPPVVNHSDS
ncbi:hypothetical protein [Chloroflexus sp.]|uniref:hypothetical protein n=1 Tax=Chloroflexus sp. TaxID=1904827 RepID=UPI00404B1435